MTYPFTEHATVLEGEVELTVAGGRASALRRVTAGLLNRAPKWSGKILTPRFVKHYLANVETR